MTLTTSLSDRSGAWSGTNGFRLMPSDPFHQAPATAVVSVAAGRCMAAIAYTWSHPEDGDQDGLLVLGETDEPGRVTAFWGDSWHQSPAPRLCPGGVDGGVIAVGYEYAAGWRWEIVVDPSDPAALRLRMDNVVPDDADPEGATGGPYPAMVMELRPTHR